MFEPPAPQNECNFDHFVAPRTLDSPDTVDVVEIRNFINGEFIDAAQHLDSVNPATGKTCALVPESTAHDVVSGLRLSDATANTPNSNCSHAGASRDRSQECVLQVVHHSHG